MTGGFAAGDFLRLGSIADCFQHPNPKTASSLTIDRFTVTRRGMVGNSHLRLWAGLSCFYSQLCNDVQMTELHHETTWTALCRFNSQSPRTTLTIFQLDLGQLPCDRIALPLLSTILVNKHRALPW